MEFIDIKEAAEILGCTERHIRRLIDNGKLAGAVKNERRWNIPLTASEELYSRAIARRDSGMDELADVPANKKDKALKRLGLIKKFESFAAQYLQTGGKRTDAVKIFSAQNNVGFRSFMRWLESYRTQGLIGLIDERGGGKFLSQIISPDAFDVFKSMYLTQQRLSLKMCWQNICFLNRNENKGWSIPSLGYMYEYVDKNIPLFVQVLHREGQDAYEAKCAPYIELDPDSIRPGEVWVGDHHQFNCWIRYRNRWIRPWVTAWMDLRSRTLTGWTISANPNQATILLAMKRGIEIYGLPDSVRIDNGRDYDSEMWTGTTKIRRRILAKKYIDEPMVAGIYAMLDIAVAFAIPYNAKAKSIERFFDTLDCQFTKTIKTYCGKDSERKPDYLNELLGKEEGLRFDEFEQLAAKYIEAYNNTAHTGTGMEERTPLAVLNSRLNRRAARDGVLDLLLRVWSGELTVGKNGVKFRGIWYGQYDAVLMTYQGKKVRVSYDPDDLRKVYVYNSATLKLITIAEQARLIQFGTAVSDEDLREAMRQKGRALRTAKQYVNTRLAANMDLTDLTIKAMKEAAEENQPQRALDKNIQGQAPSSQHIRPVRTVMDGQLDEHKREERKLLVKKAAGAESVNAVIDIDYDMLKRENKYSNVKLFDE